MVTHAELLSLVHYNSDTGIFTWLPRNSKGWNTRFAGKQIGSITNTGFYYETSVLSEKWLLHRLAWFYVHGEKPVVIDHINRDGLDNRLCNLRNVTHEDNMHNVKRHKTNKSGVNGVYWHKQCRKWSVQIKINKKTTHVGVFTDFDEACAARKAAEVEHGWHENHGKGQGLERRVDYSECQGLA